MSSKLLILTIGLLVYFFAATDAATTLSTYSDSACSNRTGMFQNTDACGIEVQTRSINGVSCFGEAPGPYYNYAECNTQAVPTTAIPEGWQYLKYATNNNCEFSSFQIIASSVVGAGSVNPVVIIVPGTGFVTLNVTATCDSDGLLSLSTCSAYGCNSFEEMPNNECRNITSAAEEAIYSGIQTSCVAGESPTSSGTPAGETPTTASPTSGSPVAPNTPSKSSTPSKTSVASSVFLGSAMVLVAVAILF